MNQEIKKQWVFALREGKYQQIRKRLRDTSEFGRCCLGVLCDLHSKETSTKWNQREYMGETLTLPSAVSNWAGLNTVNPRVNSETLTCLNDGDRIESNRRLSFKEIADLIEQQL